ncbi:MAG: hypothetical protein HY905_07295 [Deltaproteobacteria bacterium]|nr:hypothetical protein [Deltaproteobacteria bacterium]
MQEAIEHTGDLEHDHYRKLKDRFPLRLRLTPAHLHDLIAKHVLRKQPGYEEDAERLVRRLGEALPGAPRDLDGLAAIYPIHPATLALLDEVRDRFSQTRGAIDFVVRRLGGDAARGIEPFLDREWGALLTPDAIVDHFADVLEIQAEFQPVAQKLLPWARQHLVELFPEEPLRALAERLLKLLVVVHLAPARHGLTADEASYWLLFTAVRLEPERNRAIVERTLGRLAREGRWVREAGGRFLLDLQDESAARIERLLQQELARLPADELILERLGEFLADAPGTPPALHPFALPRDRWLPRTVSWYHHERSWSLWVGDGAPGRSDPPALCVRLPWRRAQAAGMCPTLLPAAVQAGNAARELFALLRLAEHPEGLQGTALLQRRIAERRDVFAAQVRQAYAQAEIASESGVLERAPELRAGDTVERWLDGLGIWALQRRYPAFERFAPAHGPLPHEAYRQLLRHAAERDLGSPEAESWVAVIREGYLVPMGLMHREGRGYRMAPRLDRNELVRLASPLLEHPGPVEALYEHLAQPVYGLVPDQVHLLLTVLLLTGEIDILKGDHSYRTAFETLPTPRHYDRLVPGRSLGRDRLQALERLARALRAPVPPHWTVQAQARTVGLVRETLRGFAVRLRPLRERLGAGTAGATRLEKFLSACEAFESSPDELTAFEAFVARLDSVAGFLAGLDELLELPQRLDRRAAELRRFQHLLSQPGAEPLATELEKSPAAEDGTAADAWLERARSAHAAYATDYRRRHDGFWAALAERAGAGGEPPRLAASRHAALGDDLRALRQARERAERARGRTHRSGVGRRRRPRPPGAARPARALRRAGPRDGRRRTRAAARAPFAAGRGRRGARGPRSNGIARSDRGGARGVRGGFPGPRTAAAARGARADAGAAGGARRDTARSGSAAAGGGRGRARVGAARGHRRLRPAAAGRRAVRGPAAAGGGRAAGGVRDAAGRPRPFALHPPLRRPRLPPRPGRSLVDPRRTLDPRTRRVHVLQG